MEFIAPIRVVVVDDRPDHLFAIANALSISGVPCIWHLYDNDNNELMPPVPEGGYKDVRLIISDLNIRNASGANSDVKNLAGTLISEVLQPILPRSPCPYGLVLWSNIQVKAEEVQGCIDERINHPTLLQEDRRSKPFSTSILNKSAFVSSLPSSGCEAPLGTLMKEAIGAFEEIRRQIRDAISNIQLQLACAWESRAAMAATATVNSVFSVAQLHAETSGVSLADAMRDVMTRLAQEAAGARDAKDDPCRALDDGLVDLFIDDLRGSEAPGYAPIVTKSIGEALQGKPAVLSHDVRAKLNAELHIETNPGTATETTATRIARGIVLGADDSNNIASLVGQKKASAVAWQEFLIGKDEFERALIKAREIEDPDIKRFEELHAFAIEHKDSVERESRLRLIEIGADCDHAQRKQRTVRLLCALEVPVRHATFLYQPNNPRSLKSDSLILLGPWEINGEKKMLVVSVGRFCINQEWPLPRGLKKIYRLRKPLVDFMLHRYSSHSSRPGIVQIME